MNSSENNNRAASQDFQTALGLLEERLRSLEDSEDIIDGLLQGAAEFYGCGQSFRCRSRLGFENRTAYLRMVCGRRRAPEEHAPVSCRRELPAMV